MPSFLQSLKASAKIFSRNKLKKSGERRQPCRTDTYCCFKPVALRGVEWVHGLLLFPFVLGKM